jgi:hypothetical protein
MKAKHSLEPLANALRLDPVEVVALMGELCVVEVLEMLRLRRKRRQHEVMEDEEGWGEVFAREQHDGARRELATAQAA